MSIILPTLWPFQGPALDEVSAHWRAGTRSVIIQAPTGSGKSTMGVTAIIRAVQRDKRALWITHRRELLDQVSATMTRYALPHGIIAAGIPMRRAPVYICSIDTLRRRLDRITDEPNLIVWDEARHLGAKTWRAVFDRFEKAYHLGLDATPVRDGGVGLGDFFKELVRCPPPAELIRDGYLCQYKMFAPPAPDMSSLHVRMGEFVKEEVEELFNKPAITGDAVSHLSKFAPTAKTLVFCVSVKASMDMAQTFRNSGYLAVHLDGECEDGLRRTIMQDFRDGRIQILCSVNLFTEGLDIAGVECVIMARPTMSVALYLQMVGRGLRRADGKSHCVILDMAANYERHGYPDDPREWSLADAPSRKKKAAAPAISVRVCAKCWATARMTARVCPECGTPFPVKPREIEQRDGELVEIERQREKRELRQTQGRSQTLDDLIAVYMARHPDGVISKAARWAAHVLAGREKKRVSV